MFHKILKIIFLATIFLAKTSVCGSEADDYFEAGLYDKAIPLYQKSLESSPDMRVRYRLGEAYYKSGNYQAIIDLFRYEKPSPESLFLLGIAYSHHHKYEAAVLSFNEYLQLSDSEAFPLYNEALLEIGMAYFLLGDFSNARLYLEKVSFTKSGPYNLAEIYLARMDLSEKKYNDALRRLKELTQRLSTNDLLKYEVHYLQGEVYFHQEELQKAIDSFERSLPPKNPSKMSWYKETLYYLGWSYLKLGDTQRHREYFVKAEDAFRRYLETAKDERAYLALGQCYLTRARCLSEESAYVDAEKVLSNPEHFTTRENQAQALLLMAQAASSYSARDKLYRQLTNESNSSSSIYAKGWFLRGLNDFQEGESLTAQGKSEEANKAYDRANQALKKAFDLFSTNDPLQAGDALKYQALALANQTSPIVQYQAYTSLEEMVTQDRRLLLSMNDPDEIYYLQGLIALRLAKEPEGEKSLLQGIADYPNGKFVYENLYLLGTLFMQQKKYAEAEKTFLRIVEEHPESHLGGDALFWVSKAMELQQKDPEEVRKFRQRAFTKYPESKMAPEAYFTLYSYRDYVQGDRVAMKHLHSFSTFYPHSPFVLNAFYLIGLDSKRDRKSLEGKWIRKKSLNAAIDAFQEVESAFDRLHQQGALPANLLEYYITLRYRAIFERALVNLNIAEESEGSKRRIYLDYAEGVFKQLLSDYDDPLHPLTQKIKNRELRVESAFWLGQTYIKSQNDNAAEKVFVQMLEKMEQARVTRGYYLSRVWYEQGMIAMRKKDFSRAIDALLHAEDTAKGKVLSVDQKLDLWIQQSFCCQELGQIDNSILILSKVINDNTVSGLRLKAMYLRAEAYEKLGRPELARRQFEATSKTGGEWAVKAKDKLKEDYGYQ